MFITNDFIMAGCSSRGGWNKKQFALLGVDWPPRRGWKFRVIGRKIDQDVADEFLALRNEHLSGNWLEAAEAHLDSIQNS